MIPVVQEHPSGCGLASVAVLAGVGYDVARGVAESLNIHAHDATLWSDTTYVRTLLASFGLRAAAGERPFTSWDALPDVCLLAIKWRRVAGRAFWHWVVFCRTGGVPVVLDSKKQLKNNVRRDFGRMKPMWYIPVHKSE